MWFAKSQEEVLTELAVDPATGLSSEEAQKRLDKYGRNKLKSKPKKYHSFSLPSCRTCLYMFYWVRQ